MLVEWLVAGAVALLLLSFLPRLLRRAKAAPRKGGGSGAFVAIGLVLAMIFDPKAAHATELIQRKHDLGDSEEGESGEKP